MISIWLEVVRLSPGNHAAVQASGLSLSSNDCVSLNEQ